MEVARLLSLVVFGCLECVYRIFPYTCSPWDLMFFSIYDFLELPWKCPGIPSSKCKGHPEQGTDTIQQHVDQRSLCLECKQERLVLMG